MLRLAHAPIVALLLTSQVLLASSAAADAIPTPSPLQPRRALTADGHDHFHGQLSPDGRTLYFAGNPDGTIEIFVQSLARGFPRRLIDESADIAQPRLSPDGRRLVYISYREDAGGDACWVEVASPARRCVPDRGASVLHVFFYPDGEHVGVLTRDGLRGPHRLLRFALGGGEGELVLERPMSAPALSPDGRWLAYVPFEATGGRELQRASAGLVLHRLDGSRAPLELVPNLPGTSSFPAFSADGRFLYFTQFLNDTSFDGTIDGNDNGVLFRVPFDSTAALPARADTYEQLTSGGTNCQYPAPTPSSLVTTCVRAGSLQIYSLPLEGLVPADWSRERMEAEIRASRDPWEQLLLLQRSVAIVSSREERIALYRRIVLQHVALREYESADFYLALMARLAEGDATLAGWVAAERELVSHRREEQRLRDASLSSEFIAAQRERLVRLAPLYEAPDPSTRRLARLAEAEIYAVLGDLGAALRRFEAIDVTSETDLAVLQVWAGLGEMLLRELDRDRWLRIHRVLALHPALDERDRLHHASAFVRALVHGRAPEEELPLVEAARRGTPDGTALALLLDLERILARVDEVGEETAEAQLVALWDASPSFEQHRELAMTTLERAALRDWGRMLDTFGRRWLDDVPVDHAERRYAEALFAELMLERAYVAMRRGESARELFREITRRTTSLEAHVGYIEASLREGVSHDALEAEYRARYGQSEPVERFAEAYLVARRLSDEADPERHAAEVRRARELLRPAAEAMPRSPEIHHLYAYLAHRQYHRTGDGDAARAAHARYHLALDLAPESPRLRANLLIELGLLQASLGNHRIALRHFEERARLPFVQPASELSFRLARARSLFHVGQYRDAAREMARAMVLAERQPALARYRVVVLDRDALYHYASGQHAEAVALYTELVAATADASRAVRLKARMMLGASALAAGQVELARRTLEEARALLDVDEPFRVSEPHRRSASHLELDDYRPIVAGLLAEARRAGDDLPAAAQALEERRTLHRTRFLRRQHESDLLESARAAQQLAALAYRRGDLEAARRYVEEGLADADDWRERSDTELDDVVVALVRAAAELHLYGGVPLRAFAFDVRRRLRDTYVLIARRPHNPRYEHERFLFATYLTLMELPSRPGAAPSTTPEPPTREGGDAADVEESEAHPGS